MYFPICWIYLFVTFVLRIVTFRNFRFDRFAGRAYRRIICDLRTALESLLTSRHFWCIQVTIQVSLVYFLNSTTSSAMVVSGCTRFHSRQCNQQKRLRGNRLGTSGNNNHTNSVMMSIQKFTKQSNNILYY
jgi:hypothetical protein